MGIAERRGRQRADREHRITTAARLIAESEGWNAVTIRRLAEEIEYSQPVLYSHFENRDAIVAAVAVAGFRDFTAALRQAARDSTDRRDALENVAMAYLTFARRHPALYAAMFTLPTGLRFADAETKSELKDAFAALAAVVSPSSTDVGRRDRDVLGSPSWARRPGALGSDQAKRAHRAGGARRPRTARVLKPPGS